MQNFRHSRAGIRAKVALLSALCAAAGGVASEAQASTNVGFLIYRVYLPTSGPGKVALPTLTFSYADGRATQTVKPCATTSQYMPNGSGVPACGWMFKVAGPGLVPGLNIAYPDVASTYWVTPFTIDPNLTISVAGQYPDARYMSFNVYNSSGSPFVVNDVYSGLADYLIEADPGSVNPWKYNALPGGSYTLRVSTAAAPGVPNTIPMPPVAADGSGGGISLPTTCKGAEACPQHNVFEPAQGSGLFPNVDSAYVAALTQPVPGRVLVVRGKLPKTIGGDQATHPVPWPAAGAQLRYWSICNNVYLEPYPVVSCLPDYQLATDAQGYFTVVVSAAADRPANATAANGVGWLQNSSLLPVARHMLIVRNMLPNQFPQAIQSVPKDGSATDAEKSMKEYYPQVWACSKSIFEAGGWPACAH